ncbi:T9SS type A sorting domain-containing protein [Spirosoma sp. HMF4905]|uniref:T9SS type A sorting domain-containing protein n=1 Tax=Spirosoma arboris TaxID=2682092 RepID=A0A7K1S9S3_9BACT|nr:T9SS type A sorting domain-containing protein [Spirosoma arboris]MVM30530.1 T9SS type A sorting domain-containing protein [Spirosoma arboris]
MNKRLYSDFFLIRILIISFLTAIPAISFGQLYNNTFTGASACPTNGNVPTNGANATGTPFTRNTITCMNTGNVFNSTTLNITAAVNDNSYIQFSVTADAGHKLFITSLSFFRQASNSAPNQLEVRYSTDGFVTSTSWGAAPISSPTGSITTWDFPDFSTPLGGTVTFRFYPYGTQRADLLTTGAKADGTFRVDDVTLNGASPLPVSLVSFTGKSSKNEVLLNWVTDWEDKNQGFEIQKSTNAQSFERIGFVEGNRNTQLQSVYAFTDADVLPDQLYYYRLKQIDIGGNFAFSSIVAVRATADEIEAESTVFPNPSNGNFTLSVNDSGLSTINLYTVSGLDIPISATPAENAKTFNIAAQRPLAPGLYYLKVNAANGAKTKALKVFIH